jgi:hypothetical protein
MAGLAGGLVETMREIGGGVNVAMVATVLASRGLDLHAFRSAYWAVFAAAAVGLLITTVAFPSTRRRPLVANLSEQPGAELAPSATG